MTNIRYAGFWKRFAATIIDQTILFPISFLLTWISTEDNWNLAVAPIISFVISWIYYAGFESSAPGQCTIGKRILGIKVTDIEGEPISFGRATGRYFAKIISCLTLGIGFMMAGWTKKRQCIHDIIADTLVVVKGKNDEEEYYEKVIKTDPRNGEAHFYLAVLLKRKGEFDKSKKHFKIAKDLGSYQIVNYSSWDSI